MLPQRQGEEARQPQQEEGGVRVGGLESQIRAETDQQNLIPCGGRTSFCLSYQQGRAVLPS